MVDPFELASGRKLWDAGMITAHTLVICSGNDLWSRPEDVTTLAADLKRAASARAVTLPGTTHHVHLDKPERGRSRFRNEVAQVLALPGEPARAGSR